MAGPLILAIETSCDETGIALVEGGRTIHSNVVASQVALHAASGGIVPEVAARAHLRWIVPVLDAALADAGVGWSDIDAVAVTKGPGLAGLPARRHQLRQGPRVRPRQAAGRRQPPRGPPLRRVAPAARARRRRRSPEFPLVALDRVGRPHVPRRDARPPDVSAPRPDRRRRGRRGVRQGRPAARPRLSGRPGDHEGGRRAPPPATSSSRGPGWATPTTSRSAASRPPRGAPSTPRGPTRALPATASEPLP